ncbi:hypothetical protein P3342_006839 [Pyrenophora teres f. teres]|nr:hypothetical protein P3342_006839 [Pyrenophora teres f. teres]
MAVAPDFLWPLVSITALLSPLFLFVYYGFRVYCIATAEINTKYQLGLAWFFIIVEFCQYLPGALLYFNRVFVIRRPRRPQLNLEGDDVPVVAVLITACREDHDTILNVVRAACETDWPKDRLSVILCDDGRSIELEDKMLQVMRKYPYAHYTSRKQPEIPDYKAGNLNNGLRFSATLNDTPSPFIAGLDVDMIIQPNWLRAMMPHLLNDPKMAMTCPPQYFWNIPRNDRVRQDLDYFYAVTELVHDGLGSADCVGSGYLARREAIDDIGGFPTYSISEDTACSSMLLGKGWSMAYIDEYLQCGEMPDTLSGHIKQRTRWTIGNVQTAIKVGISYMKFRSESLLFTAQIPPLGSNSATMQRPSTPRRLRLRPRLFRKQCSELARLHRQSTRSTLWLPLCSLAPALAARMAPAASLPLGVYRHGTQS